MTTQQFLAISSLFVLVLVALALGGCETGFGVTKVSYQVNEQTQTPEFTYENGKEFGTILVDYKRTNNDVELKVEAGDVKAFEGQKIAAERDAKIVEALTGWLEDALPGILCAAGVATACVP